VSRSARALPPGKDLRYPLDKRLGGPQELDWTQRLEEKSFTSAGDRTLAVYSPFLVSNYRPVLLILFSHLHLILYKPNAPYFPTNLIYFFINR
jgi:hypothetical protein